MAKKQREYRRLPGKGSSFLIGIATLWLGTDHLLSIDSKRVSEDYKRFYYRDIQGIITRKTVVGKVQNVFLGLFFGLFGLVCLPAEGGASIFFGILAGMFLLVLLINCWRGPTCVCHIQTGVQTDKLPSLKRLKTARKAMARLRPMIEQAQGRITPEQLKSKSLPRSPAATTASRVTPPGQPQEEGHWRFHELLFSLLLLGGLFAAIDLSYNHAAITFAATAITMGTAVCVIIALVTQHGSYMKRAVQAVTWTTLGCVCLDFFLGYILYVIVAVKNPKAVNNQWEMIKIISAMSPMDSPWVAGTYMFSICYSFALGICGVILLRRSQQKGKPHPAMSATLRGSEPVSLQA
jgi:hypothetical protein